jgi:hypothetical protein
MSFQRGDLVGWFSRGKDHAGYVQGIEAGEVLIVVRVFAAIGPPPHFLPSLTRPLSPRTLPSHSPSA